MTQKPTRPEPVQETIAETEAPEAAANEAAADAGRDALEALVSERDDLKDKLLRTLAEMENLRRRTEREVADARTYGMTSFARDMLTVADNIRRALDSVPEEVRRGEAVKPFVEGVELTERDLLKTLERHGVRQLSPQGERFDPHLHQAMFEVPDTSVPNGTVVQVVQAGFVIGERVLRPALVGVSKGGPKQPNGNGAAEAEPRAPGDASKSG